jgi:hydrogenase maturation protease
MKTIIIGLGNPFLTDDSVGIKVARQLGPMCHDRNDIDVTEAYAGGIRLLDAMVGYERAIIIDAMVVKDGSPGTIHHLPPADLPSTWNTVSVHDMNLTTALAMGEMLEMQLPSQIDIWGIEGVDLESFGEEVSEEVAVAVLQVVHEIADELTLLKTIGV